MDRLLSVYKATIASFHSSIMCYMPAGPYRDFQSWALSPNNSDYRKWQQIIGIPQFAKLTETLLGELVQDDDKWTELLPYTAWMNAYLIYETVSDNLAIGLAQKQNNDSTYIQRKQILLNFNQAMVARLKGDVNRCQFLLDEIKEAAYSISSFKQSLTETEQTEMAHQYLLQHHLMDVHSIEYDSWSPLVGNIESCVFVSNMLSSHILGDFFREGLIARYEAVTELLTREKFSIEELQTISTHSILVVPVLAYYISVLTEVMYPNDAIKTLLDEGVLQQVLEDAALMVRLTNDLGTNLMISPEYAAVMLNELYERTLNEDRETSLNSFLLGIASSDVNLTRIQKDIEFGEYNVSLHGLTDVQLTLQNLLLFGTNVAYFNQRYQECRIRLEDNLLTITETLQDDRVSRLIQHFVGFHEHIYSFHFDDQAGDYATKPDQRSA